MAIAKVHFFKILIRNVGGSVRHTPSSSHKEVATCLYDFSNVSYRQITTTAVKSYRGRYKIRNFKRKFKTKKDKIQPWETN